MFSLSYPISGETKAYRDLGIEVWLHRGPVPSAHLRAYLQHPFAFPPIRELPPPVPI